MTNQLSSTEGGAFRAAIKSANLAGQNLSKTSSQKERLSAMLDFVKGGAGTYNKALFLDDRMKAMWRRAEYIQEATK
jgi:hypothetical protein